jgi:hypothetical protein
MTALASRLRSRAADWGSTAEDRARQLPCDALLPGARLVVHRAVDVDAPPELVFRWLCQLRVAPYSYDLLDNPGRRSPRTLTPGLEQLAVGQVFGKIFRLVSFDVPEQVTAEHHGVFGHVAGTYSVTRRGRGSHLLCRFRWSPRRLPLAHRPVTTALALGDLVMARRQLLNLKRLAERDAAAGSRPIP